jgi:hypothetical protein
LSALDDQAESAFDDYVDAAFHCDAEGMRKALAELNALEQQAKLIMDTADAAGQFSKVSGGAAENELYAIRDLIQRTRYIRPRCPDLSKSQAASCTPNPPKQPQAPKSSQTSLGAWIDTKTGKPAPTVVVMPGKGDTPYGHTDQYHLVTPDIGDPNRAYDPVTGRNFARDETGQWIDTKTGKPAPTVVVMPGTGDTPYGHTDQYHLVTPDIGDPNRAYDPVTGRNFAREEVASVTPARPAGPPDRTSQALLDYQNGLRAQVGEPPLQWNPMLASHALEYATLLSQTGQLQHSSRTGREKERENIVVGARGATSPADMAQIWGNELQYFHPGKFPNACVGDWTKCGHITQILWGRTTDVGCGFASGRYDALVCRYSPPGNIDGRHVLALPYGWSCGPALAVPPRPERRAPERGR